MNVKPGDLAICIKSARGNEGKICKVISAYGNFVDQYGCLTFGWNVKFPNPIRWAKGAEGLHREGIAADYALRPISGLPDTEETDRQQPIKEIA
jgi:hypothetical protein